VLSNLIDKTKIDEMVYRPWVFGIMPWMQTVCYLVMESVQERTSVKFDRDLIKLKDGGTAGIDWNVNDEG